MDVRGEGALITKVKGEWSVDHGRVGGGGIGHEGEGGVEP